MNYIILSNIIVLSILTYLGINSLKFRFRENYKRILVFIVAFIVMSIINYTGASSLKALFIFLIMFLYLNTMFKASILNIFMVLFPYYIIITVAEIFTITIFSMITNLNEFTKPNTIEYLIALITSNSFAFIFCKIYIKSRKVFSDANLPKYTWLIFILPITTILYMTNIDNYYDIVRNNINLIIILLGLFISNLIVIFIFFKVTKYINIMKDVEIYKYKELNMQTKYNLMDQHYRFNYKLLHDLLNICNNFISLLSKQKYNELENEISKLSDTVYHNFHSFYSNSVVLNAVLSSQLSEINNNNLKHS